jgi:DNA-binding LacI/PurR family transcriptional regulator
MALGFMRTVLRRGLHIPRDVSVVGFDGISDGALYWPGLTTVSQPATAMGAAACKALLERIAAPDQEHITAAQYAVELVLRESTGPTRAGGARSVGD